jgi:hypothetical protein
MSNKHYEPRAGRTFYRLFLPAGRTHCRFFRSHGILIANDNARIAGRI